VTSGVVPDLCQNTPVEIIALWAWADKLVDVSDVIETQKSQYTETALLTAYCYNSVEKRRSFYGVPYTVGSYLNHIWRVNIPDRNGSPRAARSLIQRCAVRTASSRS
jgi:multiple sugar transport system substrate-binding protein